MDNDKKLFEELLKADGIDPAAPTESERAVFKKMLDSEKKSFSRLCWRTNGTLLIFALALIGLCLFQNILENLRIPSDVGQLIFFSGALVVMVAMWVAIIKYMPGLNRKIRKSNRKVSELYYLANGKHRGFPLVSRKNGKRIIHWFGILRVIAVVWLVMSLSAAGVYYLLCRQWLLSSTVATAFHIFMCTFMTLGFLVGILRAGLKAPLDELVEVQSKSKRSKPSSRPDIWRLIMKTKTAKLAVAAMVIIAVLLGINQFGGSIDLTSVAWADIIQTMKQQGWIYLYSDNGSNISQWWLCPEKKISIGDYNGNVTYKDFNSDISYYYDNDRNEIEERLTVKRPHDVIFEDEQQIKEIFNRPYQELEQLRRYISGCKEPPGIDFGKYRGRDVRIYKYKSYDEKLNIGADGNWLIMYLDTERELLRGYVMWSHCYVGPDPKTAKYIGVERGERAFDYPDPGPQSIYDVGVPKDAKVIDRYDETFIELLPIYNQHKEERLNRIACIITSYDTNLSEVVTKVEMHRNPDGPISKLKEPLGGVAMMFDVFYVDGVKVRREHRFNLMDKLGSKNLIQYWPKCKEELGSSYESQLAWLRDRDDGTFSSIVIDDGKNKCRFSDSFGFKKNTSEEWNPSRYGLLGQHTWPELDVRCEIIEDEYSKENDLICVQHVQKIKGQAKDDIFLFYLNPTKDYLCHKQIIEWGDGSKQVHEIEEYQQVNGRWYPKKIRNGSQMSKDKNLKYDQYKTFFIDERCDFPDDIFNINYVEELNKQRKK